MVMDMDDEVVKDERRGLRRRLAMPIVAVFALTVLAVVPYLPARDGALVYDDVPYVLGNMDVVLDRPWSSLLTETFPPRSPLGLYRPLTTATLRLDRVRGDGAARAFHDTNFALHVLATITGFFLLRRLFALATRPTTTARFIDVTAALGAAVFALHPTHAEAVAWISGRAEVLAGALIFLALRLGISRRFSWWLAASTTLITSAAGLAKESAIVTPFIGITILATVGRELPGRRRRLLAWIFGVAFAMATKWLAVGTLTLDASVQAFPTLGIGERALVATRILGWEYPLMLAWPGAMHVDHPMLTDEGVFSLAFMLGFVLIGVAVFFGRRFLRRDDRLAVLALIWIPAALVPHLHLLTSIGETVAQRFVFVASLGLGLGLAQLARTTFTMRPRPTIIVAVVVLVGTAGLTCSRAGNWTAERTLWEAELERSPTSARARIALAELDARPLDAAGRRSEARDIRVASLGAILDDHPRHAETLFRLAALEFRRRSQPEIDALLDRIAAVNPTALGLQTLRGHLLRLRGDEARASEAYRRARADNAFDDGARVQLARMAIGQGRLDHAEVLLREIVHLTVVPGRDAVLVWALGELMKLRDAGVVGAEALRILAQDVRSWRSKDVGPPLQTILDEITPPLR